MATIKEDLTLKFVTTKDGDIEETTFTAGTEVEILEKWEQSGHVLFKDDDGHLYNIPKDKIEE